MPDSRDHSLLARLAELDLPLREVAAAAAPVNLSVDLRNSGYKLAPIDVNLFPGGWHNLCPGVLPTAAEALTEWLAAQQLQGRSVILLAEWMTRNPAYLRNLATISGVLRASGHSLRIAAVDPAVPELGAEVELPDEGGSLQIERLRVHDGQAMAGDFAADWIFCNYDFTGGLPEWLTGLRTPIIPDPGLGWHRRRKRGFYEHYREIAAAAAADLGLDPWTLIPHTVAVEPVDFWNVEGLDVVADEVDRMLEQIADDYRTRGIDDRPFVVVKDEAGTFGMGILTLDSSAPLRDPNRKLRQRMQRGKGGRAITSVLVQEGVYTRDVIGDCVAEPVMMAVGGRHLGGFFRYHCERDATENLNAKGMVFARLCFDPSPVGRPADCVNDPARLRVYGWMAELVATAAGAEVAAAGS